MCLVGRMNCSHILSVSHTHAAYSIILLHVGRACRTVEVSIAHSQSMLVVSATLRHTHKHSSMLLGVDICTEHMQ